MLFRYLDHPVILLYLLAVILISLSFHEFAHAYASYKLGDPTAKNMGRLTLNPLKHLDILGTIMLLVSFFGWAKPVPINPMYYKNPKKGTMIVGFAGPVSNLILALLSAFSITYISTRYGTPDIYSLDKISMAYYFSRFAYIININLAVFNILPVPPLDGSKILGGVLPGRYYYKMMEYENYIALGFLILIFVFPRSLEVIMSPLVWVVQKLIGAIVSAVMGLLVSGRTYRALLQAAAALLKIC